MNSADWVQRKMKTFLVLSLVLLLFSWVSATPLRAAADGPVTINFDESKGVSLNPGDVISSITKNDITMDIVVDSRGDHDAAMIFDSSNPTGGDTDLGAPNGACPGGGPGVGVGGAPDGVGPNCVPLGNVLIIPTDVPAAPAGPNDDQAGGTMILTFSQPVTVNFLEVLDIEENGLDIKFFAPNGDQLGEIFEPLGLGDNSYEEFIINIDKVKTIELIFPGSGALASVTVTPFPEPKARVGDYIWIDGDGDGIQNDGADSGLNGVTVKLFNSANELVGTTVTMNNPDTGFPGYYRFSDLDRGNYYLQFLPPDGFHFTAQNQSVTAEIHDGVDSDVDPETGRTEVFELMPGDFDPTRDAGLVATTEGSIGDTVWYDTNGDGRRDPGEYGIPGVMVTLTNSQGDSQTQTTDDTGRYLFDELLADTYTVSVDVTSGGLANGDFTQTGDPDSVLDNQSTVILTPGENNLDQDFGYQPALPTIPGSTGDTVWQDDNANGLQEPDEPGIANVELVLTNGAGITQSTTTDANGLYLFDGLPAGPYTVTANTQTLPDRFVPTFDLDGLLNHETSIVLESGQDRHDVDFGYRLLPTDYGAIGDTVWLDRNGNGVQEDSEPGIPRVDLQLENELGVADITQTNSDGLYLFPKLPAGTYTVLVDPNALPLDLVQTFDPDGELDNQTTLTLDIGEINLGVDFGYGPVDLGSIGDTIWCDDDGDGMQDANESGLLDVTVTLLDESGSSQITTTDANGNYLFSQTPAGDYTVVVDADTLPESCNIPVSDPDSNPDNQTSLTLSPGENNLDIDFGYRTQTTAQITIDPPAAMNPINSTRPLTVTVTRDGDPVPNIPVTIQPPMIGTITQNSCLGNTGTSERGECKIAVTSATPGVSTIVASAEVIPGNPISATATVTWVQALLEIDPPTAYRAVGQEQLVTITVFKVSSRNGTPQPAQDASVRVRPSPDSVGWISEDNCTELTDASGSCTIEIRSTEPGPTQVNITATVPVDDEFATVTGNATVTWVAGRSALSPPTAVNQARSQHPLTLELWKHEGDVQVGWQPVTVGDVQSVTPTITNGDIVGSTCPSVQNGQCQFQIQSDVPGISTIAATASLVIQGQPITVETDGQLGSSLPAAARWVDLDVAVEPQTATRAVDQQQTLTLTVRTHNGADDWQFTDNVPVNVTYTHSAGAVGGFVQPTTGDPATTTCNTGTSGAGQCRVVISAPQPGRSQVSATASTVISGQSILSHTHPHAMTDWIDATHVLSPARVTAGIERVQVITATLRVYDGSGVAAFAERAQIAAEKIGGMGEVVEGGTCRRDAVVALVEGQCTIHVRSDVVGSTDLQATANVMVQGQPLERKSTAQINWVNAAITLTPPDGVQLLGEPYTFTVDVRALGPITPTSIDVSHAVTTFVDSDARSCSHSDDVRAVNCDVTVLRRAITGTVGVTAAAELDYGDGVRIRVATDGAAPNSAPAHVTYVTAGASASVTPRELVRLPGTSGAFSVTVTAVGDQAPTSFIITPTLDVEPPTGSAPAFAGNTCDTPRRVTDFVVTCRVTVTHGAISTFTVSALANVTFPVGNFPTAANQAFLRYDDVSTLTIEPARAVRAVNDVHRFNLSVATLGGAALPPDPWRITPMMEPSTTMTVSNTCHNPTIDGKTARCFVEVAAAESDVISATAVATVHLGQGITQTVSSNRATVRYIDASLTLTPQHTSGPVNIPQILTATVVLTDGVLANASPVPSQPVTLTVDGQVVSRCVTDVAGQCRLSLASSSAGISQPVASTHITPAFDGVPNPTLVRTDTATVTWLDAALTANPIVAAVHTTKTITITAFGYEGNSTFRVPNVKVHIARQSNYFEVVSADTCVTDAIGECTFDVYAEEPLLSSVRVTATVPVAGYAIPVSRGISVNWVDASVRMTPPSLHAAARTTQTVTVAVEQNDGSGWDTGVADRLSARKISGVGSVDSRVCHDSSTCDISVYSEVYGTTAVEGYAEIVVNGVSLKRKSGPAIVHWLDSQVHIEPNDTNPFDIPHTFTVTVDALGDVTQPTFSILPTSSPPQPTDSTTCHAPTVDGTQAICTVTINRAEQVTVSVGVRAEAQLGLDRLGQPIVVTAVTDGQVRSDGLRENSGPGIKRYVETGGHIQIAPNGIHVLPADTTHTFTVTVAAVSELAATGFVITPTVVPTITDVGGWTHTCQNPTRQGDTATCTVTIESEIPNTYTATATAALTFATRPDPVIVSTVGTANQEGGPGIVHFVDADIRIGPNGVNVVDDTHIFTTTITRYGNRAPDPLSGWTVTPTVTVRRVDGVVSTTVRPCDGLLLDSEAGILECPLTITSTVPASVTAAVDAVVDFGDGAVKVLRTATPAQKIFVDASLRIDPPAQSALVSETQTITLSVTKTDGMNAPQPADDVTVHIRQEVLLGDANISIEPNSCITGDDGLCMVNIRADAPATLKIAATARVNVRGQSAPVADEALLQWSNAQIQVTPPQNAAPVGHSQTYTVTVVRNAGGAVETVPKLPVDIRPGTSGASLAGSCVNGTDEAPAGTDGNGQCTVVVTSSVPNVITFTASAVVPVLGRQERVSEQFTATWVDAYLELEQAADVAIVGQPLAVIVNVEKDEGHGRIPVVHQPIAVTVDNGTIVGGTCRQEDDTDATGSDGSCTLLVDADGAYTVTVHAAATVPVKNLPIEREASIISTWLDASASIDPSAGAVSVGTPFTFTISAQPRGNRTPLRMEIVPNVEQLVGNAGPTPLTPLRNDCGARDAADASPLECRVVVNNAVRSIITLTAQVRVTYGVTLEATDIDVAAVDYQTQAVLALSVRTQGQETETHFDPYIPRIHPRATVQRRYSVTNTGDLTFTWGSGIVISDSDHEIEPQLLIETDEGEDKQLAPGERWEIAADFPAAELQLTDPNTEPGCFFVGRTDVTYPTRIADITVQGTVPEEFQGKITEKTDEVTDVAHYCNPAPVEIETTVDNIDADDAASAYMVSPGFPISWTYKVTNNDQITYARDAITVTHALSNTAIRWDPDDDNVLSPGETWTFHAPGVAINLNDPPAAVVAPKRCADGGYAFRNTGFVETASHAVFNHAHYCNPPDDIRIRTEVCRNVNGETQCWSNDNNSNRVAAPGVLTGGIPRFSPGDAIFWRYWITNTSPITEGRTFMKDEIVVTDDVLGTISHDKREIMPRDPAYPPCSDDEFCPRDVWLYTSEGGTARNLYAPVRPQGCMDPVTKEQHPVYTSAGQVRADDLVAVDLTHYCTPALLQAEVTSLIEPEGAPAVLANLGTTTTVTFTASQVNGAPYAGLRLGIQTDHDVMDHTSPPHVQMVRTDPAGHVTFDYVAPANRATTDRITAWLDLDDDATIDPSEPQRPITVTWQRISIELSVDVGDEQADGTRHVDAFADVFREVGGELPNEEVEGVFVGFEVFGGTIWSPEVKPVDQEGRAQFSYPSRGTPPPAVQAAQQRDGAEANLQAAAVHAVQAADIVRVWVDINRNEQYDAGEPFDIASSATPVDLTFFTVETTVDRVTLRWQTGAEVNVAGFYLYWAEKPDGPFYRLHEHAIGARGDQFGGAYYERTYDLPDAHRRYYVLEEVDADGATYRYRPQLLDAQRLYFPVMRGSHAQPNNHSRSDVRTSDVRQEAGADGTELRSRPQPADVTNHINTMYLPIAHR